jgi:hypothetical protein
LTEAPTPNAAASIEKMSFAIEKGRKSSPPTNCLPGVFKTLVPANGGVLNVKVVAGAAGHSTKSAAPMQ